jgi:hypothetical protein
MAMHPHVMTYLPLSMRSRCTLVGTRFTGSQAFSEVSSDCLKDQSDVRLSVFIAFAIVSFVVEAVVGV